MPAYVQQYKTVRPRERITALGAVAIVQVLIGLALLRGLHVDLTRPGEMVQRLVDVTLQKPPPPQPRPPVTPQRRAEHHRAAAPKAERAKLGGSPGPTPAHSTPSVTPVVAVKPTAPPSGGGTGTGPALGSGSGGGTGGNGYGEDEGGSDLEHIAGEIERSDYPPDLGRAGVGGRVSVTLTVEPTGRVSACRLTHSSGVPRLDSLTCRLMEQRFRFRPSTDRYGRPIRDEVDWDHDWIPPRE
jgi:periplasmic protein TonB